MYRGISQFSRRRQELENEHVNHPVNENVIEKLVELLIKNGADINHEAIGDRTPLQFAIKHGKYQTCETQPKIWFS